MQTVCYHQILVPQHQIKEDTVSSQIKKWCKSSAKGQDHAYYTSGKADYGGPNYLTKNMETATHQKAHNFINSTPSVTNMFSSGTKVDNVAKLKQMYFLPTMYDG